MKKRILCLFLVGVLTVCLVGCNLKLPFFSADPADTSANSDSDTSDGSENTTPFEEPVSLPPTGVQKTLKLNGNVKGIHVLGKRLFVNRNYLSCDYSGSGMEFTADFQGGDVTILTRTDGACRFLVWVDGKPYQPLADSFYLTVNGDGEIVIKGLSYGKHTVRVVKATGYDQALARFFSITLYGTLLTDEVPADQDVYVEFLGGDAASGLGVLGNGSNTYSGQDATKAYPYLLAEALETEYSILALSDANLLESMHEAYFYASIKQDSQHEYDFSKQADVTVIHIPSENQSAQEFSSTYRNLVKAAKVKNGDASRVVCVYNQGDTVAANAIAEICTEFGGAEMGYFSVAVNQKDSGVLSEKEQKSLAQVLTAVLQEAINTELAPGDDPVDPDVPDDDPIEPDVPVEPDEPVNPDIPGEGNDLSLGTDDIEMRIDHEDPAWDS